MQEDAAFLYAEKLSLKEIIENNQLEDFIYWLGYRCFQYKNTNGDYICCFPYKEWANVLKELSNARSVEA